MLGLAGHYCNVEGGRRDTSVGDQSTMRDLVLEYALVVSLSSGLRWLSSGLLIESPSTVIMVLPSAWMRWAVLCRDLGTFFCLHVFI